jgi:acetylornithine deacetylase
MQEIEAILGDLRSADAEFEAEARLAAARSPYALPAEHPLPALLLAIARKHGADARIAGMSFWTDAAILGEAGIPAVLFGPGGAGLHGVEEYVELADVETCAAALHTLAEKWGRV